MAIATIEAHELHDTEVRRVSLVKRAATRAPFKIIKSEEDGTMLDLGKLFMKKTDKPRAEVYAAIVRKGADIVVCTALLKAAGFDVEKVTVAENAHVFVQKEGEPSDQAVLMKCDNDIGFVLDGVAPAFAGYDFAKAEFTDVFKAGTYIPSPALAARLFATTAATLVTKAEGTVGVTKAADDLKAYTARLAPYLPDTVVKADGVHPSRTDAGSTNAKDAIPPLVVDPALGAGTTPAATADDKKVPGTLANKDLKSVSGGKLNVLTKGMDRWESQTDPDGDGDDDAQEHMDAGGKSADWTSMGHEGRLKWALANKAKMGKVAAKKAEFVAEVAKYNQWAEAAVAKGDFASAAKFVELAKACKPTAPEDEAPMAIDKKATPAKKADMIAKADVEAVIVALTKSVDEYERVGLKKRAASVRVDIEKLTKANAGDGVPMSDDLTAVTKDNVAATADDASNTAVNATTKKPDPNLQPPDNLDTNGFSTKIAADIVAQLSKSFGESLDGVRREMNSLGTRLDTVDQRARKAEEALTGTVLSAEPERDRTGAGFFGRMNKRDEESGRGNVIPLLDTGISKGDLDLDQPTPREIREYAKRQGRWG